MKLRTVARTLTGGVLIAAGTLSGTPPARAANPHELLTRSVTIDRFVSYQGKKVLTKWFKGSESVSIVKTYHVAPGHTMIIGVDGALEGVRLLQVNHDHFIKVGDGQYAWNPAPEPGDNTQLLVRNYRIKQMR